MPPAAALPNILLFDLGGVLIENAGLTHFGALLPQPLDDTTTKLRWLSSPAVRRFESGHSTPEEFARAMLSEWQLRVSAQEFMTSFATWPRPVSAAARDLVLRLSRDFRVACLSNSNAVHWPRFADFVALFNPALSSHQLGHVKPDPAAFQASLRHLQSAPHEIAYFDDSLPNVRAAEALGMRAHHVNGFDELLRTLTREGFLHSPA